MAISDKITYLATTKAQLKTMISYGLETPLSDETFREYVSALKQALINSMSDTNNITWNNLPKVVGSGTSITLNNTLEAPMKIDLKGNTQQNGTPTPDSPVDIKSVTGNQVISVYGKNLFDLDWVVYRTTNGITATKGEDCIILNGTATSTAYINITFPSNITNIIDTTPHTWFCKTTQSISKIQIQRDTGGVINIINPITTTKSTFGNTLTGGYIEIASGTQLTNCKVYIDARKGILSLDNYIFEPYQGQNYSIRLGNIELNKIGTYQDRIFKAIDGDSFYDTLDNTTKNSLDSGSWYKYGAIGKVVLDGSEDWVYTTQVGTSSYYRFENQDFRTNNCLVHSVYISDKFKYGNWDIGYNAISNTTGANTNRLWITIDTTLMSGATVNDFKTWLSTHNTEVYYQLATPTYTKITDTNLISDLNNLHNLKSYNDTTNISVDGDLPMIIDVSALIND